VVDASELGRPVLAGSVPVRGAPTDVAVHGAHAFVAYKARQRPSGGIEVFDLTVPASPRSVGLLELGNAPVGLDLQPGRAVVVGERPVEHGEELAGAFVVVDVSDPARLRVVRTVNAVSLLTDVAMAGNLAVGTSLGIGLLLADLSRPGSAEPFRVFPVGADLSDMPASGLQVVTAGAHAYLVEPWGLHVAQLCQP
jgi:hypothetical protein